MARKSIGEDVEAGGNGCGDKRVIDAQAVEVEIARMEADAVAGPIEDFVVTRHFADGCSVESIACPLVMGRVQPYPNPTTALNSYGYNNNLDNGGTESPPILAKLIQDPANTMMWADVASPSATGPVCDNTWLNAATSTSPQQFHGRHNGLGNVVWDDGHASSEMPYVQTIASLTQVPCCVANHIGRLSNAPRNLDQATFAANVSTLYNFYFWYDKENRR